MTFKVRYACLISLKNSQRFQDALHTVASGVFTRLAWPKAIIDLGLTKHHRTVKTAFEELEVGQFVDPHARGVVYTQR